MPDEALAQFDELVRRGRNRLLELDDGTKVFAEWYGPPPRLFVYGAVDTAEALCRGAKLLGWTAIVADARATFLTPERMPSADLLIAEVAGGGARRDRARPSDGDRRPHPRRQVRRAGADRARSRPRRSTSARSARGATRSAAASGCSRRESRRRRSTRIQGPCGLDIGADTQEETALSILAEILAVRAGRAGGPLQGAKQRIHAEVD